MLGFRGFPLWAAAAVLLFPIIEAVSTKRHGVMAHGSDSLGTFIASESSVALQGVLDNIGPDGAKVHGAGSGLVIASPYYYFFTWTRDAALTMKALVDLFIAGEHSLKSTIENYIVAQAKLQTLSNLSGNLSTGGLGEAIFAANGTAFTAEWVKRPERDGPALRATALIAYARFLISSGQQETADSILWPVISNDLSYIQRYWNQTGFDLWENTNASSFFALNAQHRALTEGDALARKLARDCKGCTIAPQLLCFLQTFWNGEYIISNVNIETSRSGKDSSSIISSINMFDPSAKSCDSSTFQPCSDRALSNHKAVIDSFRSIYSINRGVPQGKGVAVGRYPEDQYLHGNPWYITTTAAAEQLYDALYQWERIGCIEVTNTSHGFWEDLDANIATGSYDSTSVKYDDLTKSVKAYADSFMAVVQHFTPSNGSLSEQFSKDTGAPLSAGHLTWSFTGFLTASSRYRGIVPDSWGAPKAASGPSECSAITFDGPYTVPTNTAFPSSY